MSHTIHLPINAQWYDHIVYGVDGDFKKEEYRALTKHYAKRLTHWRYTCINSQRCLSRMIAKAEATNWDLTPIGKTTVTLTNGYNPTSRRAEVELLGIEIKKPEPRWVPKGFDELCFALKLGKVLRTGTVESFKSEK